MLINEIKKAISMINPSQSIVFKVSILVVSIIVCHNYGYADSGPIVHLSFSPKTNESKFERNDNVATKTYSGSSLTATLGYRVDKISLLGHLTKSEMEVKSDTSQKRDDLNYGLTLRYYPLNFFHVQTSYVLTNTELTYSLAPKEKFEGQKVSAGAGVSIPLSGNFSFFINGDYILSSKMKNKNGVGGNIIDEKGYTISMGGSVSIGK